MGTGTVAPFSFSPLIELKSRLTCHWRRRCAAAEKLPSGASFPSAVPGGRYTFP
jgi:hypothetical protein